jgi:hypothetical protein
LLNATRHTAEGGRFHWRSRCRARSVSTRQVDDPALTTDERVVAAYVAAEAAWADGDA